MLAQVPVLWMWDNVEPVAGFPVGTHSAWTKAEQDELIAFLRDLSARAPGARCCSPRAGTSAVAGGPAHPGRPAADADARTARAGTAVARRQTGSTQAFLEVEDWRPLLAFTQGNPLTVTVLTRQAIRGHHTTRQQIERFVAELAAGAATVTDDAAQGRGSSLAASLDYGFTQAFTDTERAIVALLSPVPELHRHRHPGMDGQTWHTGRAGARGGRADP